MTCFPGLTSGLKSKFNYFLKEALSLIKTVWILSSLKNESTLWKIFLLAKVRFLPYVNFFLCTMDAYISALSFTKALKMLLTYGLLLFFGILQIVSVILFCKIPVPFYNSPIYVSALPTTMQLKRQSPTYW